jgi:adenylate cyclase
MEPLTQSIDSELLGRLAACIAQASSADDLSGALVGELTRAFDVDRGSLFLLDHATMSLRSRIAGAVNHTLVVPLRIGVVGAAILQRQTLRVDDAYAHPYFDSEIDAALGYRTRSLLVAPIVSSFGKALGAIEMINRLDGGFSEDDTAKATAAAARIGRWIEEGTIYPAGVQAEATAMRRALKCERVSVFSFDELSGRLVSLYADGNDGRLLSINVRLGIAGLVAITGTSVMVRDAWEDGRFDRTVDTRTGYRTRSMLCVALSAYEDQTTGASQGVTQGVIQLINRRDGSFTNEHLHLAEQLARWIARELHGRQ